MRVTKAKFLPKSCSMSDKASSCAQNPNWSDIGIWKSERGKLFGLGDGLALGAVYVTVTPQAILKLQ